MYQCLSNQQSLARASARKVAHAVIVPGSRRIVTVRKSKYDTLASLLLTNPKGQKNVKENWHYNGFHWRVNYHCWYD